MIVCFESPWGIGGDLFGYVAGLLSTIGCLEGHSVKPVEVAAMREVCRVRGWEIPVEFSLNPPNSPAVLIHLRALRAVGAHACPKEGRIV